MNRPFFIVLALSCGTALLCAQPDFPSEEVGALFAEREQPQPVDRRSPPPEVPTAESDAPSTIVPEQEFVADRESLREFARVLAGTAGQEEAALEAFEVLLAEEPSPALRREYAGLLHRAGRYAEAINAYAAMGETALARNERLAWADALRRAGKPQEGAAVLLPEVRASPRDFSLLDSWTDMLRRAGTIETATTHVFELVQKYPEDPAVLRRAYALALEAGDATKSGTFLEQLLVKRPDDAELWRQKGGLLMARRDFTGAASAFARAVDLDPAHIPARRQLFRINNILGRHQEAEEVLQKVFVPSVDDVLRQRLEGGHSTANSPALSEWLAGWKESADPFAMHDALAEAVSAGNLGQSLSTAERAAVLLTLRDTAEMRDEQSAAWMERNASLAARTGRNVEASQLYRRLNAVEPDNISALYGLAGSLQGGGDLEEARAVYESLVAINPGDPVAAGALRKAADLLRDSIRVMANYAGEDSPGRLADINRLQFGAIYQTRLARGLVVEAGPMFWLEMPGDSPNFTAQGFRVAARYRAADWVSFQGSFGYKAYNQGGAKNTFTGGAGAEFNYLDRVRIGLAYLREDVVRNRFNIPQGTQADVFQITLATNPLRDWSTETFGRMLFYNDNNTQGQIGGSVAWTMLRNPGVLQARIGGLGMWTAKESRDVFADGELVDVIYPYWTPGQYGQGFVALSWSQNLAPEAYAGQRELSYRLGLLASMDTTSNFLVGGELALRWEVVRNLILEAAATMQRSQQWNGAFATFSADYRF